MAYTVDVFILLLIVSSPLFLPVIARLGRSYRIIAGVTAILIGVFLIIAFWFSSLIDWEAHWLLANILELVSLILLPISLVLFAVAPLLYIWFGIRFLTKNKAEPITNKGSQTNKVINRITKSLFFGIILLFGVYLTFNWWFISHGNSTRAAHYEHMNAGKLAYRERDYPAAEKHFLTALKAAEDFGQGASLVSWIPLILHLGHTLKSIHVPSIKDNLLRDSLEKLAEVYEAQGQYEKAEPFLKRNLAIAENSFGPDNPYLAIPIKKYAALLHKMNRESEAASLEERSMAIQLKHAQQEHQLKELPGIRKAQ
jgi:tetratricopeptide (TPR) repeat protein